MARVADQPARQPAWMPEDGLWEQCFARVGGAWPPGHLPGGPAVTMVIDKGVPLGQFGDLLEVVAPFVRFWKLGFASALLYAPRTLDAKVALAREMGVEVYCGGTLLEATRTLGDVGAVGRRLRAHGFRWVEVSDGTFPLAPEERRSLVRWAVDMGFEVITEVGSKDSRRRLEPEGAAEQAEADFDAGARFVVVEARDSGRGVGIFDGRGRLRLDAWERLRALLPHPERIIWEAPGTEQQRELLLRAGPGIGLGNVQVTDALTLAAMRWGLRADTLGPWAVALTPDCAPGNM